MNCYFDNAAAMEQLADAGLPNLTGNQESPVSGAANAVRTAEEKILKTVCGRCAGEYCVVFTHTGTDAICAVFDILSLKKEDTILLSGGEHAAVRAAAKRSGGVLHIIPGREDGVILPEDISSAANSKTTLAALHFVQPETGVIQDLASLQKHLIHNTLLLVDAVQGIGKIPFDFPAVKPDFLIFSGQKLGVLSGAGIICRKKFAGAFRKLRQEEHRIGRVPPPVIIQLADALAVWYGKMDERMTAAKRLNDLLFTELEKEIGGKFRKTVPATVKTSPYIAHILLQNGYQGAIVSRALSGYGIVTASGSACDAETKEPSAALQWMKVPKQEIWNALRISFSPLNDEDGVRHLAGKLREILAQY
ncbi:MAG: aminotransferase class V-fold PLP-dependent enzyme [Lentisphaeria bacterium]|nr:aminotransferase class V-fold PLP-dependent enzyme [Lentisphaeria bacterium]